MFNDFVIFVVSLPGSTERREKLKREFPKTYEKFIFLDAVGVDNISPSDFYQKQVQYYKAKKLIMTPEEYCCSLSHMKALELFTKNYPNVKAALVLEDDILGNDTAFSKIAELVSFLETNEGVWNLCDQEGFKKRYFLGKKLEQIEGAFSLASFSNSYIYRTASYLINHKMADKILKRQNEVLHIADNWGQLIRGEKIFYKPLFKHPFEDFEQSLIEKNRILKIDGNSFAAKLKRKTLNELRCLFLKIKGQKRIR